MQSVIKKLKNMFTNQCTGEKMKEACTMAAKAINKLAISLNELHKQNKSIKSSSRYHK